MNASHRTSRQLGGLLVVGTVIIVFLLQAFGAFDLLEKKTYDLRFRVRGTQAIEKSPIVLVTIDDQSFLSLKARWPFPRSYFAAAIQNLASAGASLIILDIEFTEPSSIDRFDDIFLTQAIQRFPHVILAGKLVSEFGSNETLNQYPMKPLPELIDAGAKWAYANVVMDEDGFIRRYNLFQRLGEQQYFPLVIEALRYVQRKSTDHVPVNGTNVFKVGKFEIQKFKNDAMLIDYSGPANHFPTYSFANILDDSRFTLPDSSEDTDVFDMYRQTGIFRNKIVLIGASADELQDNKLTPFFHFDGKKRLMPGVEMHANAMQTIISKSFIHPAKPWIMLGVILLVAGLAYGISTKLRPMAGLSVAAGIIVFYMIISFQLFSRANIWIPIIYPLANFVSCYGVTMIHKIILEQQEKGRYRKTFQQYVARSIVDSMLNSGELPKFGGERKNLTVLFSDIRAFTSFSEKYPPEIVVQRLTEYLTSMVDVIFHHGGTLDKFVGDEIMAIYGAPYHLGNHAERACATALDMIAALRKIQKSWSQREMEYFQIGIGINTGKVIVGNLGSIQLFDYTVIGDEVNLGARLEGANKQYATTIIISESTYHEVKDKAIVRELDNVRVKGKKRPVKIYELRGMHSVPSIEKDLIIDVYSYGLEFFKQQKWKKALSEFRRVLRYFPSDGPSRIYTMRCLEFIENPPPKNWDGVFDFLVK